jgi:hypothetical protein
MAEAIRTVAGVAMAWGAAGDGQMRWILVVCLVACGDDESASEVGDGGISETDSSGDTGADLSPEQDPDLSLQPDAADLEEGDDGSDEDSSEAVDIPGGDPGGDAHDPGDLGPDLVRSGERTLDNCESSYGEDVPVFFRRYFRCADLFVRDGVLSISTRDLPPHRSYYYGEADPNFEPFDFGRGDAYRPNPGEISEQDVTITFDLVPTPRDVTIDGSLVDGVANSARDDEYPLGPAGVALDSVLLFNPLARPGDDIEDEMFTFDSYNAHPAGSTYHYHTNTPGPLEVLQWLGLVTDTRPTHAEVELFGVMCDGTLVFGCTELDGSTPVSGDFDAQNGHSHAIVDDDGVEHFRDRYHTHICPGTFDEHRFTPEIMYYEGC